LAALRPNEGGGARAAAVHRDHLAWCRRRLDTSRRAAAPNRRAGRRRPSGSGQGLGRAPLRGVFFLRCRGAPGRARSCWSDALGTNSSPDDLERPHTPCLATDTGRGRRGGTRNASKVDDAAPAFFTMREDRRVRARRAALNQKEMTDPFGIGHLEKVCCGGPRCSAALDRSQTSCSPHRRCACNLGLGDVAPDDQRLDAKTPRLPGDASHAARCSSRCSQLKRLRRAQHAGTPVFPDGSRVRSSGAGLDVAPSAMPHRAHVLIFFGLIPRLFSTACGVAEVRRRLQLIWSAASRHVDGWPTT